MCLKVPWGEVDAFDGAIERLNHLSPSVLKHVFGAGISGSGHSM